MHYFAYKNVLRVTWQLLLIVPTRTVPYLLSIDIEYSVTTYEVVRSRLVRNMQFQTIDDFINDSSYSSCNDDWLIPAIPISNFLLGLHMIPNFHSGVGAFFDNVGSYSYTTYGYPYTHFNRRIVQVRSIFRTRTAVRCLVYFGMTIHQSLTSPTHGIAWHNARPLCVTTGVGMNESIHESINHPNAKQQREMIDSSTRSYAIRYDTNGRTNVLPSIVWSMNWIE